MNPHSGGIRRPGRLVVPIVALVVAALSNIPVPSEVRAQLAGWQCQPPNPPGVGCPNCWVQANPFQGCTIPIPFGWQPGTCVETGANTCSGQAWGCGLMYLCNNPQGGNVGQCNQNIAICA